VVRDDIAARLADSFETALKLADGLAIAEFADKPLPKETSAGGGSTSRSTKPMSASPSRRSSPARSPASPSTRSSRGCFRSTTRMAPARPAMAWAPRSVRRALIVPDKNAVAAPGRHRALGEDRQHLALLHQTLEALASTTAFNEPRRGTTCRRGAGRHPVRHGRGKSPSSMTTVCAPTRPRSRSKASSQSRAALAETDSAWVREELSQFQRPPLPGLQRLPPQARGAGGQDQWPAHRQVVRTVDPGKPMTGSTNCPKLT
jgi:excinuclease ABC subunit A